MLLIRLIQMYNRFLSLCPFSWSSIFLSYRVWLQHTSQVPVPWPSQSTRACCKQSQAASQSSCHCGQPCSCSHPSSYSPSSHSYPACSSFHSCFSSCPCRSSSYHPSSSSSSCRPSSYPFLHLHFSSFRLPFLHFRSFYF